MKFPSSFSPPALRTQPGDPLSILKSRSLKTRAGQFLCQIASNKFSDSPLFLPRSIPTPEPFDKHLVLWPDGSGLLLNTNGQVRALPLVVELKSKSLAPNTAQNLFENLKNDLELQKSVSRAARRLCEKYEDLKDGWAPGQVAPFFRGHNPGIDTLGHNPKTRRLVQSLNLMTQIYPQINSLSLRCGTLSGPTSHWLLAPKIIFTTHAGIDQFTEEKIKHQTQKLLDHFVDASLVVGQGWNGELGALVAHKRNTNVCMNEQWVHFTRFWGTTGRRPEFSTKHERLSLLKDMCHIVPELFETI